MFGGVLAGRAVAASDVAALGTAAEMKPPSVGSQTLGATFTAGLCREIDLIFLHRYILSRVSLNLTDSLPVKRRLNGDALLP